MNGYVLLGIAIVFELLSTSMMKVRGFHKANTEYSFRRWVHYFFLLNGTSSSDYSFEYCLCALGRHRNSINSIDRNSILEGTTQYI